MTATAPDGSEDFAPADHAEEQKTLADTPLVKYFDAGVRFGASDVLLRGGEIPRLRVRGELKALDVEPLDAALFETWVESSLSPSQWAHYARHGSIDVGMDFPLKKGTQRFRINIYRTRGRSAIAARHVSDTIKGFDDLHLPAAVANLADLRHGLVLICGITGSGKSTTIAAILQRINEQRNVHMITIEDPIEYLFKDSKAVISQREIGIDVPDFSTALRALVREDPDVVFIGELRDKETFEAALQASETGHLVFSTIHASSASQAFGRIYDLFNPDERESIRHMLAYHMQAILYQKLVATIRDDPPRVPAVEILRNNPTVRKYILDGREGELLEVIKGAREDNMEAFLDSLVDLVEKQLIHPRTAQAEAPSAEEVKMRLRGIRTSVT